MPKDNSAPRGPYRHLLGGEYRERRHEPGDRVDPSIPPRKIKEWLDAEVIEPERPTGPRKEQDDSERTD